MIKFVSILSILIRIGSFLICLFQQIISTCLILDKNSFDMEDYTLQYQVKFLENIFFKNCHKKCFKKCLVIIILKIVKSYNSKKKLLFLK